MKFNVFGKNLKDWYKDHYRPLPWRNTQDPYVIWLSEIILQQTRVQQGLPYFNKFLSTYPTVKDLARASPEEVMRLWQGLGYYSRARNLLKCAKVIVKDYKGHFPNSYSALKKLPGIGPYTAAAIASFAYHIPVGVVDGNVFRVLSRLFGVTEDIGKPKTFKLFQELSEKCMPRKESDLYNQAIMEFGATVCLPKNPKCDECVFSSSCYAYKHDAQANFPVKEKRVKIRDRKFTYVAIINNNGCLMKKRLGKDIWAEMYDFLWLDTTKAEEVEEKINFTKNTLREPDEVYLTESKKHILSHQKLRAGLVTLRFNELPSSLAVANQNLKFYTWQEIEELPKPVLVSDFLEEIYELIQN